MFVDEVDVRQAWTFGCTTSAKPRPLFTDGALECDHDLPKAAMGGQYSSPLRNKPGTLVAEPRAVMNLWRADSKEHVSGLVELYECM
jgi:hypothetical protein